VNKRWVALWANLILIVILVLTFVSVVLLWNRGQRLSKKHYQKLLILGLLFSLGAVVLTDVALSGKGNFKEAIKVSEIVYYNFGGFIGMISKALLGFLVVRFIAYRKMNSVLLEILNKRIYWGDVFVIFYFYFGLVDFLNDLLVLMYF